MDKVYIIIVNYKTEELSKRAILSIKEESIECNYLIVDNESTNESFNKLKELETTNYEVIQSKENLGFAGGVNFGFNHLIEKYNDVKYFFLLNPDAIATKNVISNLLSVLMSDNSYCAISPHIYDNNTKENWFAGTMIDFDKCKITNSPNLPNELNSEIDVFNGCAVLFDAQKFKEAGMFDEDTFLYYDEANLSMNLKKLNYKCIYVPTLDIYHDVSSSTGNHSFLKSYYMMRNHIYFFKKNKPNCRIKAFYVPLKNLISATRHLRISSVRGILLGVLHYLLNKKGKQI